MLFYLAPKPEAREAPNLACELVCQDVKSDFDKHVIFEIRQSIFQ